MSNQTNHLSDEQVLLLIDGEMSISEATAANEHLELCPTCRLRRADIEGVLEEVISAHQGAGDSALPPATGPRALLKLRLKEAAEPRGRFGASAGPRPQLYLYAALVVAVIGAAGIYQQLKMRPARMEVAHNGIRRVPNRSLTPGMTRPVQLTEICAVKDEDRDPPVESSTLEVVLREYGIGPEASAEDYQVDYLINPQLGGTNDIQNLWPEPYTSTVWNAKVKDALEDRLHQMVCEGKIDLASAQRDIATDWIAAYQKYFHTPKPV